MKIKISKSLLEKARWAMNIDPYTGFCLACGDQADGVDPDAEEEECDNCGKQKVYGAEQIIAYSQE